MYDDQVQEFREKIGRLEEEIVQLEMENIRLKNLLLNQCPAPGDLRDRKFVTSTFCGTEEQYQAWLKMYGRDPNG